MPFVKIGLVLIALILCRASASAATAQADDKRAAQLLRESIDAPKRTSYIGQLQTVRFASNGAAAMLERIEHKAPSLTRRWFLAPEALYGDYVVTRGAKSYRFNAKRARMIVSNDPRAEDPVFASDRLDLMLRNYRPLFDDVESTANHPTSSILLINKYTGERAMRIWIDNQTHLVLRKEEFRGNGAVASQMRFEAIRYTNNIPDDIFAIESPAGFTRTEGYSAAVQSPKLDEVIREAGFRPYMPKDLPQGFVLADGNLMSAKNVKTLRLTYTDGLRTVSLFENDKGAAANYGELRPHVTRFEGHEAHYIEDGSTTLLTWTEHDLHFALAGDLGREELQRIAASVVP
jgi:outer membrane lipoprotein-sorting protein